MQAKLKKCYFIDFEFYTLFLQCILKNSTKLKRNNLNINFLRHKSDILINNVVEYISIPINSKNIPAFMFLHTLCHSLRALKFSFLY